MARRRRGGDEGGGGSWLDTYADMVTLLLTFFIMLFSMSTVQEEKWEAIVKSFANSIGTTDQIVFAPEGNGDDVATNQGEHAMPTGNQEGDPLPADFNDLYDYLRQYVEQNNMTGSVEVSRAEGSVFIRLSNNIIFNPDAYELRQDGLPVMDFLGACLKNVEEQILVININGHTAAVPYENYPVSDRRLSGERASSVAIFFEDKNGVDPKKIRAIGYGKEFPVASNDTPQGREKNRRVDIIIISDEVAMARDGYLYNFLTGTFDPSLYPESGGMENIFFPPSGSGSAESSLPHTPPQEGEVLENVSPYE